MNRRNTEDDFWALVTPTGFCWEFGGYLTGDGYGIFALAGRSRGAHRIAYELLVGAIPPGSQLDHLCRTRNCVNPDHVEVISPTEHSLRSNRRRMERALCVNGHERTACNRLDMGKYYRCRQCVLVRTHQKRGKTCAYDMFCDAASHGCAKKYDCNCHRKGTLE